MMLSDAISQLRELAKTNKEYKIYLEWLKELQVRRIKEAKLRELQAK